MTTTYSRAALAAATALMMAMSARMAGAQTVATIYGMYDTPGISGLPSGVQTDPLTINHYNDGGVYDTPSLFFVNPSGYTINSASMLLQVTTLVNSGQNTYNNGVSQTVSLGTLAAHSITQINWGSGGPLFSSDYDDEYGGNYGANPIGNSGSFLADCTLNTVGGHSEWTNFCAPVGNFFVTFTGTLNGPGGLNGQTVAAVFGEYDVNSVYTGWEGLDQKGWSESLAYDVHSGQVSGVLANIDLGDPNSVSGSPLTSSPEPSTIGLVASGLIGLAGLARRRRLRSAV